MLLADGIPAAAGNWELSACPARSSQALSLFEIVWAESDPNATGCAERFLLALLVQAYPKLCPRPARSSVRADRIELRGSNRDHKPARVPSDRAPIAVWHSPMPRLL
jgi:hypothetical protein